MSKNHDKVTPNCIYSLEDEKIGHLAKALLVRLAHLDQDIANRGKDIFFSNQRLARDLSVSIPSIINAMKQLQKRGYVVRDRRHHTGAKITELNHAKIIARLLESPESPRHAAWLKDYYRAPPKKDGRYHG